MQPDRREPDDADERAWRAIVENYGDRARLDDLDDQPTGGATGAPGDRSGEEPDPGPKVDPGEPPVGPTAADPAAAAPPPASTAPFGGRFGDLRHFPEDEDEPFVGHEEGFEPPEPPPLPRVTPDRGLAWLGVFGAPVVLLVALIFSISLPPLLGYGLVVAFVGGFGYLVYTMPREPRDPWDDGAQV